MPHGTFGKSRVKWQHRKHLFTIILFLSIVISFILVSWQTFSFLFVRVCDEECLGKPEGPKPCQKYGKRSDRSQSEKSGCVSARHLP